MKLFLNRQDQKLFWQKRLKNITTQRYFITFRNQNIKIYHKSLGEAYKNEGLRKLSKRHKALAKYHEALAKAHQKAGATHEKFATL